LGDGHDEDENDGGDGVVMLKLGMNSEKFAS